MIQLFSTDRTRIVATAKSLGKLAPDSHIFTNKAVLLTGDSKTLATENGRNCFLNCFRLLIRMVANLTVHLSGPAQLIDAVVRESERISKTSKPVIEVGGSVNFHQFDAILSVGSTAHADLPWTAINSNGWVARVSSRGQKLSDETGQANPVGALAAACFGVTEVFKRLIALRPERGEMISALSFSFYSYSESESPGPVLPDNIPIDLAVIGAGAIGNGIIHLLDCLPVTGRVGIVDYQSFQVENWGTCLLIGPGEFNVPKAEWAARLLKTKLEVKPVCGKVEDYVEQCGKEHPFPRIILNGLDNIPARRAVQELWPDQIIDGAIGPTACEVTMHPWPGHSSCLLCDFEMPLTPAEIVQRRASGLRGGRLGDPFSVITDEDIAAAPPEKREWLNNRKGKPVCSVISEAVLSEISTEAQKPGFEPSAPFVACLSSCMIITELVRYVLGWPPILETGFQFDSLVGPQNGVFKKHLRKPDCECVTRRANIEVVRTNRANKTYDPYAPALQSKPSEQLVDNQLLSQDERDHSIATTQKEPHAPPRHHSISTNGRNRKEIAVPVFESRFLKSNQS